MMTSVNVSQSLSPIHRPMDSPGSGGSGGSGGSSSGSNGSGGVGGPGGTAVEQSPVDRTKGFFPDESEPLLRCDSTSSKDSALSRNGSFITKGEQGMTLMRNQLKKKSKTTLSLHADSNNSDQTFISPSRNHFFYSTSSFSSQILFFVWWRPHVTGWRNSGTIAEYFHEFEFAVLDFSISLDLSVVLTSSTFVSDTFHTIDVQDSPLIFLLYLLGNNKNITIKLNSQKGFVEPGIINIKKLFKYNAQVKHMYFLIFFSFIKNIFIIR